MSTIKVDNIQGTSGTSTALTLSGANSTVNGTLNVDGAVTLDSTLAVTGVHTVGTNAVATADGGTATTSIVQGLAKVWITSAGDGASIFNSFNVSSLGDDSTGVQTVNINNDMSNGNYAIGVSTGDAGAYNLATANVATGSYKGYYYNIGSSAYHDGAQKHVLTGDLA